jgi:hypothetical protein
MALFLILQRNPAQTNAILCLLGKETCSVDKIIIVAHSMGGYVARLAPIRHPHIQRYLPHIVTLATPHDNPLYAFDESIHRVHQSLFKNQHDNMSVVSISGGIRDEMIDPKACEITHGSSPSVRKRNTSSNLHCATFWNSYPCL